MGRARSISTSPAATARSFASRRSRCGGCGGAGAWGCAPPGRTLCACFFLRVRVLCACAWAHAECHAVCSPGNATARQGRQCGRAARRVAERAQARPLQSSRAPPSHLDLLPPPLLRDVYEIVGQPARHHPGRGVAGAADAKGHVQQLRAATGGGFLCSSARRRAPRTPILQGRQAPCFGASALRLPSCLGFRAPHLLQVAQHGLRARHWRRGRVCRRSSPRSRASLAAPPRPGGNGGRGRFRSDHEVQESGLDSGD